jgi:hypothetical protein
LNPTLHGNCRALPLDAVAVREFHDLEVVWPQASPDRRRIMRKRLRPK